MAPTVVLREVRDEDLETLFRHQQDPVAGRMAAFTAKDPADRAAFMAHWGRIRSDPTVTNRAVLADGRLAGYVASFLRFGTPEVSYWLGREFWGRGIATAALAAFLPSVAARPLYARVVKDNAASLRVLEKCGFVIYGEDRGFANARGGEAEEYLLVLGAGAPPPSP